MISATSLSDRDRDRKRHARFPIVTTGVSSVRNLLGNGVEGEPCGMLSAPNWSEDRSKKSCTV